MAGAEVSKQAVSDLPVRLGSAIVMLVIAGGALWLGGWVWTGFVAVLSLGVLWEWNRLVSRFGASNVAETLWFFGGVIYVGGAALAMMALRNGAQFFPVNGQSLGYGYVRHPEGVSDDFLKTGRYELVVANAPFPATLSLTPFYDALNQRVKS